MNPTLAVLPTHAQALTLPQAEGEAARSGRSPTGAPSLTKGRYSAHLLEPACLLCRSALQGAGTCVTDALHHTPGVFRLLTCPACGMRQTLGAPTGPDLAEAYPPHYLVRALGRAGSSWRQRLLNFFVRSTDRQRADLVRSRMDLTSESKVLEIGCNNGNFLAELHRRTGCQGFCIEMDAEAALEAGQRPGLTVFRGEMDEALPADGRYDGAVLWHVLEHLPDPVGALKRLERAVRPGGQIFIMVPDSSGWAARIFGRYWFGLDIPRHCSHFTPETLCASLSAAGWRPLALLHVTEVSTIAGSLHNLLRRRWCDNLTGRLLSWLSLQGLCLPFDHLFRLLGGGDWLVAVARNGLPEGNHSGEP